MALDFFTSIISFQGKLGLFSCIRKRFILGIKDKSGHFYFYFLKQAREIQQQLGVDYS